MNKNTYTNQWTLTKAAGLVSFCLLYGVAVDASEIKPIKVKQLNQHNSKSVSTKKLKQTQVVSNQYIIQLNSASTIKHLLEEDKLRAKKGKNITTLAKQRLGQSKAKAYKDALTSKQLSTLSQLKQLAPSLNKLKAYNTLANAILVTASASDIKKVKSSGLIKSVYPVTQYYAKMDRSHQIIKSEIAWQAAGGKNLAGQGTKIAIIDTGIRNENPLFSGEGNGLPDLSANSHIADNPDYCRIDGGDPNFCNDKLILARWMNPTDYEMDVYENEYMSPLDFDGHGSHVAGIAAGKPIQVTWREMQHDISGVAPAASIMAYKAMYTVNGGYVTGSDAMLLEALELAINDGADVINNSWGSGPNQRPEDSIFKDVLANAEAAGVVVVNAAGNDLHAGMGNKINCPACIESGIAVANTTNGRFFGNAMTIADQSFMLYQGENNHLAQDKTLKLRVLNVSTAEDDAGCDKYTNHGQTFEGQAVMFNFSYDCDMKMLSDNIASSGGSAIILRPEGVFGTGTFEPVLPSKNDEYSIPVFGVSKTTGEALLNLDDTELSITAAITQGVEEQFSDMLHPFSSPGPNTDPAILKPDIAAPGTNILSAYSPDIYQSDLPPFAAKSPLANQSGTFALLTGTSMAAPHVAGAAALLRQLNPSWSAKQIKSAMSSTSKKLIINGHAPAIAFDIGAGRLDLENAIKASINFNKTSLVSPSCIGLCSFENEISNLLANESEWQIEANFKDNATKAVINLDSVQLAAKGSDASKRELSIDIDTSLATTGEWVFGEVSLSSSGYPTQHIPIAVFANDTDDDGILVLSNETITPTTGDNVKFDVNIRNKNLQEELTLNVPVPTNAHFVQGSELSTITNGELISLTYDDDKQNLTWKGKLNQGSMALTPVTAWGNETLSSLEVDPIACSDGCESFDARVDFNFSFNGNDYTSLTISDNGFIVPGLHNIDRFQALFNQNLPKEGPLNNVIAPLWAEYDLLDEQSEGDTGGGYVRGAVRQIDGKNFLVVEWDKVRLLQLNEEDGLLVETSEHEYTFQIIIEENTDNIWFNYLSVPEIPAEASIGAENIDGSIGTSLYFNGEDNPLPAQIPAAGYTLKLETSPEGKAEVSFELALSNDQDYGVADSLTLDQNTSATLDVLSNDHDYVYLKPHVTLTAEQNYQAIKALKVIRDGDFNPESLEIETQPTKGTVEIVEGKVKYTATDGETGADSFSYKVADAAGKFGKPTSVAITLNKVNQTPTVTITESIVVDEGASIVLTAEGADPDGDSLTYTWNQTAGDAISTTQDANKLSFMAPEVKEDTTFKFTVKVSDGSAESETKEVVVKVNNKKSSGGSFGWLLVLPFALLTFRRNK